MDASFTPEQDGIRRTLRELLRSRLGPHELRAAVDTPAGHDPALWTALAEQLGLPGLALPDRYGGVGGTVTDLALACEETGRFLAPSPLLATAVLVAPLVLALGTDAQRADLLPRLASGTLTATLAVPGTHLATALALTGGNGENGGNREGRGESGGGDWAGGHWAGGDWAGGHWAGGDWAGGGRAGGVQATRAGDGWRLYGQADQVLDGHSAGLLLVAAHTGGFARSRTLLFLVPGDAPGLVRVRQTALDQTRPQARVQLRHVDAELLGDETTGVLPALAAAGDTAAAVLACEAVGAADQALTRTVEYVGQREQFGRAIGSFQAVKHRLADVYVQLQAARSAAYYAAWATAQGERVGGLALAQALEALRTAAAEGIQLHGGIGFTWEHEAHLYFKRASGDELLCGPVHRLRAHAADTARLFRGQEVTV